MGAAVLAGAGIAAVVPPAAPSPLAEPPPNPYCAYDPTGNAGSWSDPCEPAGRQPDGRYNPPAVQWAPAIDPDTGLTRNPFGPGQ